MKIEKNIPMPESATKPSFYQSTLLKMEVGDSVVTDFNGQNNFRAAAKKLGYRVAARKLSDPSVWEGISKFRLWRTE